MGWSYFNNYKRADVIDYLRRSLEHGGTTVRQSTAIGNNFWALLKTSSGQLCIAHILLRGGTRRDPGYGYKELSHHDGVDCPVEYLRFLPDTEDPKELEWRAAVQEHHRNKRVLAKAKSALKPGDEVVYGERTYRLEEDLKRRGWRVLCIDNGERYRMQARQLSSAMKKMVASASI